MPASYNDLFADAAIRDHVGWVWYQRTVRVPRGWAGERVFVRFDAATHEGVVYVDDDQGRPSTSAATRRSRPTSPTS